MFTFQTFFYLKNNKLQFQVQRIVEQEYIEYTISKTSARSKSHHIQILSESDNSEPVCKQEHFTAC